MQRQRILIPAVGLIMVLALGCGQNHTDYLVSDSGSLNSEEMLVFQDAGTTVYRLPGGSDRYRVVVTTATVVEPGGHGETLPVREALERLPRSATVIMRSFERTVHMPGGFSVEGLERMAPNPTFVPKAPSPWVLVPSACSDCPCCTVNGLNCECSWGCLKKCFE